MSDQLSFDLSGTAPDSQPLQLTFDRSTVEPGKVCRVCKEWKPKSAFGKNRLTKDKLNSSCLECSREQSKKANAKIRKTPKIRLFDLPRKCLNCKRVLGPEHFTKDPTRKDGLSHWCRDCFKEYRDTRGLNAKRSSDLKTRYREDKSYQEYAIIKQQNNRARRLGVPGLLTIEEWQELKAEFNYCCAYCGYKPALLVIDHFWPVSWYRKGFTKATNDINNIIPACEYCNDAKQDRSPFEFLAWKNGLLQAA